MASSRQIEVNRLNSQKSTGPRTPAGKAVSRSNALKTGIYAQELAIKGEDPDALARLVAEYHAEFLPATPRQRDLVDTLAFNQWQIQRLRRIDATLWNRQLDTEGLDKINHSQERCFVMERRYPLNSAYHSIDLWLDAVQRRIQAYERSSQRALRELRQLQAEEAPDPEPIDPEPTSTPIGFVPSNPEITAAPIPNPQSPIPRPQSNSPSLPDFTPPGPAPCHNLP